MERNYFVAAQDTACGTPMAFWALRSPHTTVTQPRASTMLIGMRGGLKFSLGGNSSQLRLFLAENPGQVGKKNKPGRLRRGALHGRWKGRATMSLIAPECGRMLFCTLAACAAMGQVLESRTSWGGRLSAPLLAMGSGLLLSTCGIVPASAPAYDLVLALGMPMAVAMSLLETDVMRAFTDAGATLKAFWFGALGTVLGTVVGFSVIGRMLGPSGWKVASSLCASYVGGSVNYAATAQALGMTSPSLLAAGMAADNLAMAVYFSIIMSIPAGGDESPSESLAEDEQAEVKPTVESLSLSMAAAVSACMLGNLISSVLPPQFDGAGLAMMAVVASIFSTFASVISSRWGDDTGANIPIFAGAQSLSGVLMLLFFAVVGTSTRVKEALAGGWPLFIFILILFMVHLGVTIGLGTWSKIPMRTLLIASNANVGGPATAAAMASSKRWPSLVRPALLVGTLGYTVGTAIGCVVGSYVLRPMFHKVFLLSSVL